MVENVKGFDSAQPDKEEHNLKPETIKTKKN
jgi:hypothetical protein